MSNYKVLLNLKVFAEKGFLLLLLFNSSYALTLTDPKQQRKPWVQTPAETSYLTSLRLFFLVLKNEEYNNQDYPKD